MSSLALTQPAFWSRQYPSLVRYFMLGYPTLYLTLLICLWHSRPKARVLRMQLPLLSALGRDAQFPPAGVPTNYENGLELVDQIALVRAAAVHLAGSVASGSELAVSWPFSEYFAHSVHGVMQSPYSIVNPSGAAPAAKLVFSSGVRDGPPGNTSRFPGYRLDAVERRGRVWAAILIAEHARVP